MRIPGIAVTFPRMKRNCSSTVCLDEGSSSSGGVSVFPPSSRSSVYRPSPVGSAAAMRPPLLSVFLSFFLSFFGLLQRRKVHLATAGKREREREKFPQKRRRRKERRSEGGKVRGGSRCSATDGWMEKGFSKPKRLFKDPKRSNQPKAFGDQKCMSKIRRSSSFFPLSVVHQLRAFDIGCVGCCSCSSYQLHFR